MTLASLLASASMAAPAEASTDVVAKVAPIDTGSAAGRAVAPQPVSSPLAEPNPPSPASDLPTSAPASASIASTTSVSTSSTKENDGALTNGDAQALQTQDKPHTPITAPVPENTSAKQDMTEVKTAWAAADRHVVNPTTSLDLPPISAPAVTPTTAPDTSSPSATPAASGANDAPVAPPATDATPAPSDALKLEHTSAPPVAVSVSVPSAAAADSVVPPRAAAVPAAAPLMPVTPTGGAMPDEEGSFHSVIEYGTITGGTRVYRIFNSFFNREVDVFTARSDPEQRPLYCASDLAEMFDCTRNMLCMYLCRRKSKQNLGIYQATAYALEDIASANTTPLRRDLKRRAYFLTQEVCENFSDYMKTVSFRDRLPVKRKESVRKRRPRQYDSDEITEEEDDLTPRRRKKARLPGYPNGGGDMRQQQMDYEYNTGKMRDLPPEKSPRMMNYPYGNASYAADRNMMVSDGGMSHEAHGMVHGEPTVSVRCSTAYRFESSAMPMLSQADRSSSANTATVVTATIDNGNAAASSKNGGGGSSRRDSPSNDPNKSAFLNVHNGVAAGVAIPSPTPTRSMKAESGAGAPSWPTSNNAEAPAPQQQQAQSPSQQQQQQQQQQMAMSSFMMPGRGMMPPAGYPIPMPMMMMSPYGFGAPMMMMPPPPPAMSPQQPQPQSNAQHSSARMPTMQSMQPMQFMSVPTPQAMSPQSAQRWPYPQMPMMMPTQPTAPSMPGMMPYGAMPYPSQFMYPMGGMMPQPMAMRPEDAMKTQK